jgi:hypothetical protein
MPCLPLGKVRGSWINSSWETKLLKTLFQKSIFLQLATAKIKHKKSPPVSRRAFR